MSWFWETDEQTMERRVEEWVDFIYRQYLSRVGVMPTMEEAAKIKSAVRVVAQKICDGDEQAFEQIVRQYGHLRQGIPVTGARRRYGWQ